MHAKIIPGVSPEIVHNMGVVADRLSVNIEFPSENSLTTLAPQKKAKREHRLYQADWLLRFYGFGADEILSEDELLLLQGGEYITKVILSTNTR